jgi:hypothetical protein
MNDVFISYAHIDNETIEENQKGWITQLHRILQVRLAQLMGAEPRIWRDQKLSGSDLYDQTIVEQFLDSKILVSVLSPRYINSDWCNRELDEFCTNAEQAEGLKVDDKSRVFKVVKTPLEVSEMPPRIRNLYDKLLGFEFYETDPESGRVIEYNEVFGAEAKQRYFEKVYDLAHSVYEVLKTMKIGSGPQPVPTTVGVSKTIFLAEVSSDLFSERDQLRRDLIERGHKVLPEFSLPPLGPQVEQAMKKALPNCDISIHLVGQRYGMIPEESDYSMAELQNLIAAKFDKEGFDRLIWLPKGGEPQDEKQKSFVNRLVESPEAHRGAEVIVDTLENFKEMVVEKLTPKPDPVNKVAEKASTMKTATAMGSETNRVYLICDQGDEESVEPLEDFLYDQGFEVSLPDFEGDETEVSEAHRQNLVDCDSIIVFYGTARNSWVDIKLRELMKATGYGRSSPIENTAVFVAPPYDRRKERYRSQSATVIQQGENFSSTPELESFIEKLKSDI